MKFIIKWHPIYTCCWGIVLFVLYAVDTHGQDIILSGYVKGEDGESLQGVSISLITPCKDSVIVAFTTSNKGGLFHLKSKAEMLCAQQNILLFNSIGYSQKRIVISNGTNSMLEVALRREEIVIKEVIVRAPPSGFRQSKDTTEFNLSHYTDGLESKLEDILRKLPGISVSDNGAISFKGRSIDKILIEGDEFFSKNYTLLSKNISAALIDGVDAIERYNDERLLKGVTESNKIVLDVKLKKGLKPTLFGDANLGVGTDSRYNSSTNLFSFRGKTKVALIGNANNTGYEAISNIEYSVKSSRDEDAGSSLESETLNSPIPTSIPVNLDVGKNRYLNNRAYTGGLQINLPISERFKINSSSYLNSDRQRIGVSSDLFYILPESTIAIFEQNNYTLKPLIFSTDIKATYGTSLSSGFTYKLTIDRNINNLASNILNSTNQGTNSAINSNADQSMLNLTNSIGYINRISESKAIVVEGGYAISKNDANLYLDTNTFAEINNLPPFWNLKQNNTIRKNQLSAVVKLLGSAKSHTYSLSTHTGLGLSKLYSSNRSSYEGNEEGTHAVNDLSLRNFNLSLDAGDHIKWRKFELELLLRLQWQALTSHYYDVNQGYQLNSLLVLPKISVKHSFGAYSTARFTYDKTNVPSSIADIYRDNIITNYLNLRSGTHILNNNERNSFLLSYIYSNTNNQWIFSASSNLMLEESPFTVKTQTYGSVISNIYTPNIANSTTFYNRAQSDKYLRFMKSNLRVMLSHSNLQVNSLINDLALQRNRLSLLTGALSFITAFDLPVNFQIGSTFNRSTMYLNNASPTNGLNRYYASINIKPIKFVQVYLSANNYNWESADSKNTANFLDMEVQYNNPNKKWELRLSGNNLLNTQNIAFNYNDNFILHQSAYHLIDRYLLTSISFKF